MTEHPDTITVAKCHPFRGDNFYINLPGPYRSGVEYIRADVSAARIADLEQQLAEALEEAAVAGGDAAVEMLLRQEPDASPLKVQMTRQAIAKAIRNLKGTA